MLIDTHCHLYSKEFYEDIDDVIARAINNDVKKIILPNIDSSNIESMKQIQNMFPDICYSTLGLHPTSVKVNYKQELDLIFQNPINNIVAIGEIGIDLYWDKTFIKEQEYCFDYQLNIAIENNLPVIIHSRKSIQKIFEMLKLYKNKNLRGIFHCYPGNYEEAKKTIDLGFLLGIGGVLTYKNSSLPEILKKIPLNYIVLETDAPYLSPVPLRGTRNEPAYIKNIAEKLSEILNLDFDFICKQTSENAMKLIDNY